MHRISLDDVWRCTWNCGFTHKDYRKAIEHENKAHDGSKCSTLANQKLLIDHPATGAPEHLRDMLKPNHSDFQSATLQGCS